MTTAAPLYGSWTSPISATDLVRGERPIESGLLVAGRLWWSELLPDEGGRYAVHRHDDHGGVQGVLPRRGTSGPRSTSTAEARGRHRRRRRVLDFADGRLYRLDGPVRTGPR